MRYTETETLDIEKLALIFSDYELDNRAVLESERFAETLEEKGFVAAFEELFDGWGYDYSIRENYSGRGMFGETCRALVAHDETAATVREVFEVWEGRWDNMGYGIVVY